MFYAWGVPAVRSSAFHDTPQLYVRKAAVAIVRTLGTGSENGPFLPLLNTPAALQPYRQMRLRRRDNPVSDLHALMNQRAAQADAVAQQPAVASADARAGTGRVDPPVFSQTATTSQSSRGLTML